MQASSSALYSNDQLTPPQWFEQETTLRAHSLSRCPRGLSPPGAAGAGTEAPPQGRGRTPSHGNSSGRRRQLPRTDPAWPGLPGAALAPLRRIPPARGRHAQALADAPRSPPQAAAGPARRPGPDRAAGSGNYSRDRWPWAPPWAGAPGRPPPPARAYGGRRDSPSSRPPPAARRPLRMRLSPDPADPRARPRPPRASLSPRRRRKAGAITAAGRGHRPHPMGRRAGRGGGGPVVWGHEPEG